MKNLFNQRKKLLLAGTCFSFSAYYFNEHYLKTIRGLNKLKTRFENSGSNEKKKIIVSPINLISLLFMPYNYPLAIVCPENVQECQKIINYANKYGFQVQNQNQTTIKISEEPQYKPYIILNQKYMNEILEFIPENETVRVGTGISLSQIDQFLQQHGYTLPKNNAYNKKLFEIINADNIQLNDRTITSLEELIVKILVVLGSGECLHTSPSHSKKIGPGSNLNSLFIGSNANLGIPIEAVLKVQNLQKEAFMN